MAGKPPTQNNSAQSPKDFAAQRGSCLVAAPSLFSMALHLQSQLSATLIPCPRPSNSCLGTLHYLPGPALNALHVLSHYYHNYLGR